MERQKLTVRYEVPVTWLIGGFGVVASSLFYAGWQAADLKTQLESAVRLGKEVTVWMQTVSKWLPQTYIIHGVRTAALSTEGISAVAFGLQMLAIFGAIWVVIGYVLFNRMERRARKTGAIGQY